jgi:ketosteroid isomerase-like protein
MKCQIRYLLLLLLLSSTIGFAQQKTDELAIRAVLEGHSLACLNADVEKAVSYYAHSPYVATAFSEPGYQRGYDAVAAAYRKEFTNGQKSPDKLTTQAYRYRIVGNVAFVTYIETYTKPDGAIRTSHKACYLEKENGRWELIGNFWIPEQAP